MGSRARLALAAAVILVAAFLTYRGILFPRDPELIYPWSSDSWGHLIKAEYLLEQIRLGHIYPDLFPAWYSGQQMLRYYAPLPYYALVGLLTQTDNVWIAGNMFIAGTAAFGGVSFLLFRRYIGLGLATLGGVLYVVLPDNIRVAMAEGNLPRIMATALLPLCFYFLMNMMAHGGRRRDFAGLAITLSVIVVAHAMMAGIFVVGMGLYVVLYWLTALTPAQVAGRAILALITGLMLSGWWLLPSLTGGITEIDQEAASEAIASFSASTVFNPGLRASDPEIFYVGLALFFIPMLAIFMWRRLEHWQQALVLVALITGLISTTLMNTVWMALPFHQLFWPMRFMSFAGFVLLLAALGVVRVVFRSLGAAGGFPGRFWRYGAVVLVALLVLDAQPSLNLVRTRDRPADVVATAERLRELQGWRVATADVSRLGSAPAQLFTSIGGREQVFGWAFQGSITAPLIARIIQAIDKEHTRYAVNRFARLGADDIVVMPSKEIGPEFVEGLLEAGYEWDMANGRITLYHRDGVPRGVQPPMRVFGVGKSASNLSFLFPEVLVGGSEYLDDYDTGFLKNFDVLVLARFKYHSRKKAEEMVREFAAAGKKVLVDLTGAPLDTLSGEPKFLGVYGEPVLGVRQARPIVDGVVTPFLPFDLETGPWRSVTPQGADEIVLPFEYVGSEGAVVARNYYGDGDVTFLGLNMIFHAVLTSDPFAVKILEGELGTAARQIPDDVTVPLEGYVATQDGYRFSVTLAEDQWVLFPMGNHPGTRVLVDGDETEVVNVETLSLARVPAGTHEIVIRSERTRVYRLGQGTTAVAIAILLAYIAGAIRPAGQRRKAGATAGQAGTGLPAHGG